MSRFCELIDQYCANMDRQKELDEALLQEAGREEWIGKLRNRSIEYEEINRQNNEIIRELKELIDRPMEPETVTEYHARLIDMFNGGYDEFEILIPLQKKLLGLGLSADGIITIHNHLYFEESVIRANALDVHEVDVSHLEAAIAYFDHYTELRELNRNALWGSYFNYCIAALEGDHPDPDTCYRRLRKLLDLWEREDIRALDGDNEEFRELIDGIKMEWLGIHEHIEMAGEETQNYFCDLAEYYFSRECAGLENSSEYNSEIYAAYLIASIIRGRKSREEAITEFFDYYETRCQNLVNSDEEDLEEFYFATNAPMTLESWCRMIDDEKLKKRIINSLIANTKKTWYNRKLVGFDSVIDSMLRKWCFTMTKYMRSQSEKIDWILELVVRRQVTTYLHSAMVRDLSEAIGKEMMRQNPAYFDCIPEGYGALEFIRSSALLHDIGKTSIATVITTQGRMLSDDEFMAIKKHPSCGYSILGEDDELKCYADVASGHHKFYDGTGGYPADFDNVHSVFKPIIDIITVSDCLDAATDHLGRNYKRAKSFEQVLEEFEQGKGTKYSPEVVDLISNSSRLRRELEYIVGEGRVDTMYKAYLQNVI